MIGGAGVYPGSFDPPTIAHAAVAEAALRLGLSRIDLTLSRNPLGKAMADDGAFRSRVERLDRMVAGRSRMRSAVRGARLVTDLAEGYDAVVVGADKWRQILEPRWYGGWSERDRALARLPTVLIAPRGDDRLDDLGPVPDRLEIIVLDLDPELREVSSTAIRDGEDRAVGWEAG